MNQEKGKQTTLRIRLMPVVALGIIYGWIAPKWLAPHRHNPSSFLLFIGFQLITMGTAIIFTLGRKPGRPEIAALVLVVLVWVYLFFFVMLNSFGS
jgi:Ca2+/Na+ antiporter